MTQWKKIGPRLEDYLTTIYRFEEVFGYAKTTELSRELKISPATVSKVIRKLEENRYVTRIKYRRIQLTNLGRDIARRIIRKHRIAEFFLYKVLGFNELESHRYAHYMEHLPDEIVEKIYDLIGKPHTCPHGNPVPGVEVAETTSLIDLASIETSSICVIKKLAGEFIEVLEFAHSIGLRIGDRVKILYRSNRQIDISIDDRSTVNIPVHIARYIYVYC